MNDRGEQQAAWEGGRLVFANQLRAVAAVLVMVIHLFGVYWAARDTVAQHIFAPVLTGPNARIFSLVDLKYFNFGPLGVSLFFLISGFVIPFSLAKTSGGRFLAARALRIYPTYMVCLAIALLAVWLSARYWQVPFGWNTETIVHNLLLIGSVTYAPVVDLVNWSLAIEIKFYLVMCLLASQVRQARIMPLLLAAIGIAMLVVAVHFLPPQSGRIPLHITTVHLTQLARDLMFIPFMLIGTLFYYRFRGRIGQPQLWSASAVLFGLFLLCWPYSLWKEQFPSVPLHYLMALGFFALAYGFRRKFRPCKPVDWLAAISYPVYALHSLVGYASLRYLTAIGWNYYLAAALSIAGILGLAYAVHRLVELPTIALGKKLASEPCPPPVPAADKQQLQA